jgi:hypothetical protein
VIIMAMNVYVRYNGRTYEFAYNRLDVRENAPDLELKQAVERACDLPANALVDFEVDRYQTAINVRPQAKFG